MKLNDLADPCIIISASGMAEAGRIRHHLKNNIGDAKNLILFVVYARNTRRRANLAHQNPVNIFGDPYEVRAQIASIDSFSGHADKNECVITSKEFRQHQKICVIHGEESRRLHLPTRLRR